MFETPKILMIEKEKKEGIKLSFCFGIDIDFKRVKWTIEKLSWYKENGYNVILPDGIDEESSDELILSKIKEKYNEQEYKERELEVISKFS